MSNLVLLSGEREKREQAHQAKLIAGLQELLAMAENGQIKAVCYAALDCMTVLRHTHQSSHCAAELQASNQVGRVGSQATLPAH